MRWMRAVSVGGGPGDAAGDRAQAADEVSTTDRLQDRREVAAGTRAYCDRLPGRPLLRQRLAHHGRDGRHLGAAAQARRRRLVRRRRRVGRPGHPLHERPRLRPLRAPADRRRCSITRTDFVPDGRRAALFGLDARQPGAAAKTVTVKVDVHSELMGAYPWTGSEGHPTAADNLPDIAAYEDGALIFTRPRHAARRQAHDYAALVGSTRARTRRDRRRLPRPAARHASARTATRSPPRRATTARIGKGAGGQLRYRVTLGARGVETRLDRGRRLRPRARRRPQRARRGAEGPRRAAARPRSTARDELAARSQRRPARRPPAAGGRRLGQAEPRRPHADGDEPADPLRRPGQGLPARRSATLKRATFVGAGYPDYPWLFATDGEYTAFAAVALGQFETDQGAPARAARRLGRAQRPLAARSRTRSSPTARSTSAPTRTRATPTSRSSSRARSRSSGAGPATTASATASTTSPSARMRYVTDKLDADKDGWPEGLGNVERDGHGRGEARQRRLLHPRPLRPRRHGRVQARPHDASAGRRGIADRARALRRDLVGRRPRPSTRTRCAPARRVQQQHWIGVTPMEAELTIGGRALPGLAPAEHATAALDERESDCFSGSDPFNLGLFHTGCEGGPDGKGERKVFSLTTAIQAVGEGNYGRGSSSAATRTPTPTRCSSPTRCPARCRRSSRRPDQNAQHRPLLDLPLDVHAGLGPLRHRVAGDPPAARRAPVARHRRARVVPQHPGGPDADRRPRHPARRRRRRRPRAAQRQPLHDHGHRRRRRGRRPTCASARRSRPARRSSTVTLDGDARAAPDRARDQPRRRGHGAGRRATGSTWWW